MPQVDNQKIMVLRTEKEEAFVLVVQGTEAERELTDFSRFLSDWPLWPTIPENEYGLLVWEGSIKWHRFDPDAEPHYNGQWRKPNREELWWLACTGEPWLKETAT